jgi:N-acetyl-anhydromuramyl-L-alanine amidase AmpD
MLRFIPRRRRTFVLAGIALAVLVTSGIAGAQNKHSATMDGPPPSPRQLEFASAAHEFGVPEPLLLAVSYTLTRWEDAKGAATDTDGGFGPMHLTAADGHSVVNAAPPAPGTDIDLLIRQIDTDPALHTLERASALVHAPPGQVSRDSTLNVRAGAALLASYVGKPKPASIDGWYQAVAKYVGGGSVTPEATRLANEVYDTLRSGASGTTTDGQHVTLVAQNATAGAGPLAGAAQCPASMACRFAAAAGYEKGQRSTGAVNFIVLGTAGTTYEQAVAQAADPKDATSAHYLVRGTDGQVTQLVRGKDIARFTGSTTLDAQSLTIGLDSVGGAGLVHYSEATYASTAALVKYLATQFHVPLDRQHVLGRDELPSAGTQVNDPGGRFDWGHLFALMDAELAPPSDDFGRAVAFVPAMATNTQAVRECATLGLGCADLGRQQVNFVPLRTAPEANAPLLSDAGLHNNGSAGSADLADTGDKAVAGQVFAVAQRQGAWTAIWYGGQLGWFKNSAGLTRQVRSALVTPKAELTSVDVFDDPEGAPNELYALGAGQSYPLLAQQPNGFSVISFDHRIAFVRTSDLLVWPG